MTLAETQAQFWKALYGDAADASFVAGPDRLHVYSSMFLFRQVDALRADFPEVAERLGDSGFFEQVRAYVREHPSEHPDLGQLGRHFAAFLKKSNPELVELARLEWARSEVFLEAEATAIGVEEFARKLRIRLVPALRLAGRTAVWRKGFEVQEAELPAVEARALELALSGAPFADVCGAFGDPALAFEALQSWIGEGWLAAPDEPA
ncbi:MAG TPA: DNA-binding domain-containing protein [Myxococcales bacterium]|nr:DNA-binding domain-containing protein [Myxococcales bacterium]